MRTVTFSNPEVAREVNSKFVPVWINRGPGFRNTELDTERRIFNDSEEAYATRNICTFFMTPDLQVAHYVAGYYAPDLFGEALRFVGGLKRTIDNPEAFRSEHARFAKICRDEFDAIQAASRPDAGKKAWDPILRKYGCYKYEAKHKHGPGCLHFLGEAMGYWARLHNQFASSGRMPTFNDVRANYMF